MRRKSFSILLVLCASIVLKGDGCLVKQKDVSMVLAGKIPAQWDSQGYTQATFVKTDVVSAGTDVLNALNADNLAGVYKSIKVVGAVYEVLKSTGHDARRAGTVTVNGNLLLTFDVPHNTQGIKGNAGDPTLTLGTPGLNFINGRLQQFLDSYNVGAPNTALLDFTYTANWTSTPAPSASDPDAFTWTTDLVIQVEKTAKVDVPNI
jgi:hypothetical protein